jgi:hypothetical protein
MPGLISESDSEDEVDHEIATLTRHRIPPRQVPVVRAGRRNAVDVYSYFNTSTEPPRIPDHIEDVEVYATPCRVDLSPEIVEVSLSTSSHTVSGYEEGNDPWSSSASSGDFPVNFPPLSRPDGGRARPATFAVNGRNCVIDDCVFRVCRRRSVGRAAQPEPVWNWCLNRCADLLS